FVENDNADNLLALVSVTNSRAFGLLVSLQLARTELAQSYEVGLIQNTPIPRLESKEQSALAELAARAWGLYREIDKCSEISHAFNLLPCCRSRARTSRLALADGRAACKKSTANYKLL